MLVPESLCSKIGHHDRSPSTQACHLHKLFRKSVTNIDATLFRYESQMLVRNIEDGICSWEVCDVDVRFRYVVASIVENK